STLVQGLTVGETYFVRIYSYYTSSRQTFDICIGTPPAPPANDDSTGAIELTVNADYENCTVSTNGTTWSATASTETAPSCNATGANDDVWYSFTATSQAVRFAYSNITSGTIATALYTGTPGSLTQMSGACLTGATVDFNGLAVGTTYYVRVY